jgi:hypothetical protein
MRNHTFTRAIAAVVVLLMLTTQQALALWSTTQLTPKNLDQQWRKFTITTKDVKGLKEFEITIEASVREFSPFTDAELSLIDEKEYVAVLPIEIKRKGNKMTFRFRLSAKTLPYSKFELREPRYIATGNRDAAQNRNEQGDRRVEQIMGGDLYWFWLRDFVPPDKK